MDIVGGQFNHLIPSDQLDDSLLLGQNLECEASDDFESSPGQSKDSLKNMLSDKDPMFGSASSQFHLLENQDVNFKLANLTGPSDGENGPADTAEGRKLVTRFQRKQTASRGRAKGRRPGPGRRFASEDQESPSKHTELETSVNEKREALLHRRFKAHEVDSSMNPVVVLRRLTVTVGGYKIELLPGPSQTFGSFNTNDLEALGFQEDPVSLHVEKPSENMQGVDNSVQEVVEVSSDKPTNENIPMDFGPYVNPNEVQEPKNTLLFKPSVEKPAEDQIKKPSVQKPQKKNGTAAPPAVKKLLKRKPSPPGGKNKPLNRPALTQKPSSHARDDKTKPIRPENQATALKKPSLKRPAGPLSPKSPSKLPKAPDGPTVPVSVFYPVSKKPSDSSPVKIPSPNSHKRPHNPPTPTSKTPPPVSNSQGSEKKPEKILQKQRSRNSRSVSVEEPQLFVPDNAPVVKKDAENEAPESDAVWDPSKHCGLCKKPHGNRFMVGCGRCDDWFHGDCVGLDLTKVQQMEKEDQEYVCLKCCADEEERSAGQSTETPDEKTKTKPKPQPSLTSGGIRPFRKDARERRSTDDSAPRSGSNVKHESKKVKVSHVSSKQPSTGQIRRSVRDSLEEILLKRLKESSLKISTDKPAELARRTEKELFALFQGVDSKYKNKYRSLTFNLKDSKNNVLFKRVLKGEVSPTDLVRMTAEELASKELAAWRQRENRHTIEMIEKEQRDVDRRPITKITHKGEIEIENQEPAKAPETMEVEPEPKTKATEVAEEKTPESKADSPKKSVDTTNMHKSHLFDLNCKICTGRMAPPTEEAGTKVVKVATTVVKRQSSSTDEALQSTSTTASALMDDLSLRAMEEGFLGFLPESRSDSLSMKEDTETFLTSLEKLWGGFVDMPAVARLLTKAYPVSGILDHLTQDLPDSIQVGGRISPSIVWDYVEKIRASGTKEICVIRLSPDTEEDEISYALLYAYFSSRKRYGVVANNRKQVKDMYLIPLGATEKIPHQIVPFDGPGLESNRPNLLLGLIIRHRSKRDFEVLLPSDASENPSFLAETKSQVDFIQNSPAVKDSEQRYISSLGVTHKKDSDLTKSTVEEPLLDTETDENVSLRFLPGVLNLSGNTPNDSVKKDHISSASNSGGSLTGIKPPTPISASRLERFIIKKKDSKMAKTVQAPSNSKPGSSSEEKEREQTSPKQTVLSLSDKPADVSTEAFLSLLAASKPDQAASAKSFTTSQQTSEDTSEASKANDDSSSAPKNVSSNASTGILKNAELLENNSSGGQVAQPSQKISEDKQVLPTIPLIGNEGVQPPCDPAPNPNVYNPPPAFHTAPRDTQDPVTPYVPLQPQVPLPFTFPTGPPPSIFPLTDPHALPPPWPPTVPPQTIPGLSLAYEASPMLSDSSGPSVSPSSKDPKSSEKSSSDSGSKSSKRSDDSGGKEDRDHYDRHHHKSKHYERERDKYRERSHSHKDRYSKDERYERHHGGHYYDKSKHRRDSERDRHRRDSDRRL